MTTVIYLPIAKGISGEIYGELHVTEIENGTYHVKDVVFDKDNLGDKGSETYQFLKWAQKHKQNAVITIDFSPKRITGKADILIGNYRDVSEVKLHYNTWTYKITNLDEHLGASFVFHLANKYNKM